VSRNGKLPTCYLGGSGTVIAAPPLTMSYWGKVRSAGAVSSWTYTVGTVGSADNQYYLGLGSTNKAQANERDTVASGAATLNPVPNDVWFLHTGVFTSHSSRAVLLNATAKQTNANARTCGATNGVALLGDMLSGGSYPLLISHVALWDIALSDAEVALLLTFPPSQVRPENLQEYWPLLNGQNPEPSFGLQGNSLAVTDCNTDDDNPILYPYTDGVINRIYRSVAG
jgi:hypothetical protein